MQTLPPPSCRGETDEFLNPDTIAIGNVVPDPRFNLRSTTCLGESRFGFFFLLGVNGADAVFVYHRILKMKKKIDKTIRPLKPNYFLASLG